MLAIISQNLLSDTSGINVHIDVRNRMPGAMYFRDNLTQKAKQRVRKQQTQSMRDCDLRL